eukprot:12253638-Prorocentrum_lima.AAC.1
MGDLNKRSMDGTYRLFGAFITERWIPRRGRETATISRMGLSTHDVQENRQEEPHHFNYFGTSTDRKANG